MNLLLFLSALLAALTGVSAPRAAAQPVQASATAGSAASASVSAATAVQRFMIAAYGSMPPLVVACPRAIRLIAAPLFAHRRRE